MFVTDNARLTLPVDIPHRIDLVTTVVVRLTTTDPTHHARLVAEVPIHAAEDRRRLDPHNLLMIQDAELLPDSLNHTAPLVRVPAVDRRFGRDDFEDACKQLGEEPFRIPDVDFSIGV